MIVDEQFMGLDAVSQLTKPRIASCNKPTNAAKMCLRTRGTIQITNWTKFFLKYTARFYYTALKNKNENGKYTSKGSRSYQGLTGRN